VKAVLVAVGSELLRPGRRESHSEHLTSFLEEIGLEVRCRRIVSDCAGEIVGALVDARRSPQVILVTGGIGPTRDDRTRLALAKALGRPLRLDPASEKAVRRWCRGHRFPYTAAQKRQAFLPAGARGLPNTIGSAPGIWFADPQGAVAVLPGVAAEMRAMLHGLAPRLRRLVGRQSLAGSTLHTAGRGESELDSRITPLSRDYPRVEVTTLASPGEVTIQLRARGRGARGQVARYRGQIARRLGADLVSEHGETLEEVVCQLLRRHRLRLATAESCTAGMVSARITSVPGSSRIYLGGAVCYNDRAKSRILSVPRQILFQDGAVSRRAALAMARGAAALTGAEVAVAVTGIAGPGGGTPEKPVGTIHWAVLSPFALLTRSGCLSGDREKIRLHATAVALDLVRRILLSKPRDRRERHC